MKKYENMTYEELNKHRIIADLLIGSSCSGLISNYIFTNNIELNYPLIAFYFVGKAWKNYLKKKIINDEDLKIILKTYKELLINLNSFAKDTMEISSALEAFLLIDEMNHFGCFSYDKNNNYKDIHINNEIYLLDSLVMNGHGVCRHLAPFLQKYMTNLGYESDLLVGVLDHTYNLIDPLIVWGNVLNDDNDSSILLENDMKELYEKIIKMSFPRPKINRKILKNGNHILTRVNDQDKTLYLDLARSYIYLPKNDILISESPYGVKVLDKPTKNINNIFKIEQIKVLSSYTPNEINQTTNKLINKIINNCDLYEKFYLDNKDMLEVAEIAYQKIQKKHF